MDGPPRTYGKNLAQGLQRLIHVKPQSVGHATRQLEATFPVQCSSSPFQSREQPGNACRPVHHLDETNIGFGAKGKNCYFEWSKKLFRSIRSTTEGQRDYTKRKKSAYYDSLAAAKLLSISNIFAFSLISGFAMA